MESYTLHHRDVPDSVAYSAYKLRTNPHPHTYIATDSVEKCWGCFAIQTPLSEDLENGTSCVRE
jgi:hypothetical protein